jgi:quinol-cytochrome oxidoreductase complex cytochrome b subunit
MNNNQICLFKIKMNIKYDTNQREIRNIVSKQNYSTLSVDYKIVNLPRMTNNYWIGLLLSHILTYPTPVCLTYAWSFGSLAGLSLIIQMITGLLLSSHYVADTNLAFYSIEYIMRDVPNGWLLRYVHSNGASMFFIVVYGHMVRSIYYGSYMEPRQMLWCSGVVLFLLMMGTAFSGYVLPWGQMSLWGATVITSMVTVVPIAGQFLAEWVWGGYTVNKPTLRRFYTLHLFLPYLTVGMTFVHLAILHKVGSNSPIGSDTGVDDTTFYPYFFWKDIYALMIYLLVFAILTFWFPNHLNHPTNCIPADPMKTPAHVVPEWYFLPYYAILRSIPHKAPGIYSMFGSLLVLFVIPFIHFSQIRNTTFRPIYKPFFWMFISDFIFLMWVGQMPIRDTYALVGFAATVVYFVFFFPIFPLCGLIETYLANRVSGNAEGINAKGEKEGWTY